MRKRRFLSLFLIALAATGFGLSLLVLRGGHPTSASQIAEPWPAFTMTYKVVGWRDGDGSYSEETRLLEYNRLYDWTETTLSSDVAPERAGYQRGVDKTSGFSYFPDMNLTTKDTLSGPTLPTDWLVPGREAQVSAEAIDRRQTEDGTSVIRMTELQCDSTSCNTDAATFKALERWQFDKSSGLPLLVELTKEDGTLLSRVEVQSLTVR